LVPEQRQDIFAPRDGEIQQLHVEHDHPVEAGQELARMTSVELTLELKRLRGEIETTQQKLRSIRAERVRASAPTAADRQSAASWSALEKELEKQDQSLRDQLAVIQAEEARLTIRSPIRGRIQTWDLQRLLEARPVLQGQVLMTVADVEGPWVLELEVPDHHIAHVTSAKDEQQGILEVTYILKTDPETVYRGYVERIGMTTVSDQRQQAHVQAVVRVDRDQIRWLRSGASVVARIHCGRRPVGYVWLHDLIDAVRTWILF
jgi:multidrug efflux pump subunit AcrA (membrane-fusion protein)